MCREAVSLNFNPLILLLKTVAQIMLEFMNNTYN